MSEQYDDIEIIETDRNLANPFPGLRPFNIDESHLFFGREGQSDEVLLKLSKHRFVGVIGPSGSGKSSFIYCGVLPILYGGFLTETGPNWDVIVTRPGAGPIENLAEAILSKDPDYAVADAEDKRIKKTITTTLLKSSSLGLVEAILQTRKRSDNNYLVLVDQFEELFRFKDSKTEVNTVNETLAFVNMLIEAVNYTDVSIYVAITMRSDFIGDCAQFPDLTRKINDSHYLIPQMTREQKRRAITGPVAVGGAQIAPRLVQQLLNDLGDNPDQLPILQHALMRTWSYWSAYRDFANEELDIKHYEAIGTMGEALSMHANEAYDELTDDQKRICENLFKAITEKRGENFGIRRPTRLEEIASISGVTEEEVIAVVEKFRQPGRSLITPAAGIPLQGRSMIDISHESLMRIWVRLKNWVDDEAEAVNMYLRLAEAAAMHQVGKAGLWRPPDLQLALNWELKHKPTLVWGQRYHPAFERTMVFLEYSKKEYETELRIKELQQKRALQRARATVLVLASATVISIAFLIYAFAQQAEAVRQKERAEEQRVLAIENEQAAIREKEAADIAREEAERQKEIAEEEKIKAEIAREEAVTAQKEAEEQRNVANQQRVRAEEQTKLAQQREKEATEAKALAEKNEQLARAEKEKADRLRMLAIGKTMAIKSQQFKEDQIDLKGLLAQQAYQYNKEFNGYVYDYDVYDGLYYALKAYDEPLTRTLGGHDKNIRGLTASTKGNVLFSGDGQGKILRWRVNGDERTADTLSTARSGTYVVRAMAVSKDDTRLVVGGEYPKNQNRASFVEVFTLTARQPESKRIEGVEGNVWDIVSGDGYFMVLDKDGMSLKRSDYSTSLKEVVKFPSRVNDVDLSHDGKYLVAGAENGNVYMIDIAASYALSTIYTNRTAISAIALAPESYQVAIGDRNGGLRVFTLLSNQPARGLVGHTSTINSLVFSSNGQFLASGSGDKTVRLWNRKDPNQQPITLSDHEDWVWSVAFTSDNQSLMAGTQFKQIKAWPTQIETMGNTLCDKLTRNLTQEEWDIFVGEDIEKVITCSNIKN
jgi:WD40 repeat protein/energy-coupling factor transporter ATP-binding protein EcfA2